MSDTYTPTTEKQTPKPRFETAPFGVTSGIHVVIDTWERGLIVSEHATAAEARKEADRVNAGFVPGS